MGGLTASAATLLLGGGLVATIALTMVLRAWSTTRGSEGLVVEPPRRLLLTSLVFIGSGMVVAGSVRWLIGTGTSGRGFVPLVALSALVFAGWWLAAGRPWRTSQGERIMFEIRLRYDADLSVAAVGITSLPIERAMPVIALYGRDALTDGLSGLRKVITGRPTSDKAIRTAGG